MAGESKVDRYDVLGVGIVTVDDLLYVESYPPPDSKVPVRRRIRQCGGLTGTALVAASRLGSRCAFAGFLGQDELSEFVREAFRREDVDVSNVHRSIVRKPIHSTIIVDETDQTRTIFFEKDEAAYEGEDWPPADLIRTTRVLFLDHDHAERGIRIARIALEAGIPVVADFERDDGPHFEDLLPLADHLIINQAFAERLTGKTEPGESIRALQNPDRVVVVTCGIRGVWFSRSAASPIEHQPAFPVAVVDTTGCGDVFHGAYASALAEGQPLNQRIRFASAAAALKATRPGAQAGSPTREQVDRFLQERGCPGSSECSHFAARDRDSGSIAGQ